jgi:hypothetical protein
MHAEHLLAYFDYVHPQVAKLKNNQEYFFESPDILRRAYRRWTGGRLHMLDAAKG